MTNPAAFTVDRKELLAALRVVQPAVGRVPLDCVRLSACGGQVLVEATDCDLALSTMVPCSAFAAPTRLTVRPRALITTLSRGLAGGDVTFTVPAKDRERVRLEAGSTSAWVDHFSADDWPKPHADDGEELILSAADVEAIRRVAVCASRDDARPILGAVSLADGFAVGTDSYRLSAARISATPPNPLLIPLRTVCALPCGPVVLRVARGIQWGSAAQGGWSRLVEGDFPNWQVLMPTAAPTYSVVFDREGLAAAVGRAAALIGSVGATPLIIEHTAGGVRLGARDPGGDLFSESIDAAGAGDGTPLVAVNPELLLELLRSFGSRRVRVGITGPLKPLLITAEDDEDGFRSLLVPVRVDSITTERAA